MGVGLLFCKAALVRGGGMLPAIVIQGGKGLLCMVGMVPERYYAVCLYGIAYLNEIPIGFKVRNGRFWKLILVFLLLSVEEFCTTN